MWLNESYHRNQSKCVMASMDNWNINKTTVDFSGVNTLPCQPTLVWTYILHQL